MRFKIKGLFNAITILSLCSFTFPALIITEASASNARLNSLKMWSLIMIAVIDIFIIGARILLRDLEINLQILKNLSILLTDVLGLMMYGVSTMLTQIFLEKEIDWIFTYQTLTTIIVGLILGTLLFFIQLYLKEEETAETMSMPLTYIFLILASVFMLCKNELLNLNSEAMLWVRVSGFLTIISSVSLPFISGNRSLFANIWEELYIIAYVPVSVYWYAQGILQIMQQVKASKEDNLQFLIFCSWVLFCSIAPAIIQSILCVAELFSNLVTLILHFSGRQNGLQTNPKPSFETDVQSLKHIQIEDAKEKICPICWEEFGDGDNIIARESCCHCYHVNCLKQWIIRDLRCPLCRGFIQGELVSY